MVEGLPAFAKENYNLIVLNVLFLCNKSPWPPKEGGAIAMNRLVEGLIDAMKTYDLKEGLILTDEEESEFEQDGFKIFVKPIWKWLLSET